MSENQTVATNGLVAVGIPKPTPSPIIVDCELAVSEMELAVEIEDVVIIHL